MLHGPHQPPVVRFSQDPAASATPYVSKSIDASKQYATFSEACSDIIASVLVCHSGLIATGHWLLFQPCTDAASGQALWLAATYNDRYDKVGDRWLISHLSVEVAFFSPFEKGWAEQRFLDGREP